MAFELDRDRFVETMKYQAEVGATENGGLHRLTLSEADKEIRDWFLEQMEAEGLDITIDEFGNMFGYREERIRTRERSSSVLTSIPSPTEGSTTANSARSPPSNSFGR